MKESNVVTVESTSTVPVSLLQMLLLNVGPTGVIEGLVWRDKGSTDGNWDLSNPLAIVVDFEYSTCQFHNTTIDELVRGFTAFDPTLKVSVGTMTFEIDEVKSCVTETTLTEVCLYRDDPESLAHILKFDENCGDLGDYYNVPLPLADQARDMLVALGVTFR